MQPTTPIESTARHPNPGYDWHNFDFEKILLDPCARSVFFPEAFSREAACRPGSNAGQAATRRAADTNCAVSTGRTIGNHVMIPTGHLRNACSWIHRNPNSGVPESHRGTFLGVVDKIPYLVELGSRQSN